MKFLNGWKTVGGVAGIVATILVSGAAGPEGANIGAKIGELAQHADAVVVGGFSMLSVLGLIHKGEKRAARIR